MTRVYKPKSKREQLERKLLDQIKALRKKLNPKTLKNAEVSLAQKEPQIHQEDIPIDQSKNRETIELFLKIKETKKPLN